MTSSLLFRVYDKQLKKMIYPKGTKENIQINGKGNYLGYETPDYWLGGENCVLMQSLGIKDCNKKLIYESDIVKVIYPYLSSDIQLIKWNSKLAAWGLSSVETVSGLLLMGCKLEVIGNLYEQPELYYGKGEK